MSRRVSKNRIALGAALFAMVCLSGACLAQSAAVEFVPGVVSTGHEFGLTFTPDGKQACFSRFAKGQPTHIYCSRKAHGQWQAPREIAFSSTTWSDLDPFFTPDGKQLFFVSTRPYAGKDSGHAKDMDIWVVDRNGSKWGEPHPVENVNSAAKEGSPSVARNGTLYFFSERNGGPNQNAIYASMWVKGHYVTPQRLASPVNSGVSDTSPFISPDGKTLLFYSTRDGGHGKADIYVSFQQHGGWSAPVNLGPSVNTAEFEYNPAVSPDGRWFYFGRNGRIYAIRVAQIPALKKVNFR